MQFLERLRAKPSHVRTRYALAGSFMVTALISVVWFTTLPARFAEVSSVVPEDVLKEQTASVENSFDSLFLEIQNEQDVQEIPSEDPEVEYLRREALSGMDGWNTETERSTTSREYLETSTSSTVTKGTSPIVEAPKENIILIGTTTKKSD